jgi:sporulation integral membrane protein YtvI
MLDELEYHLPSKWMKELTKHVKNLITVLGGYLKAQVTLIFISFVICLIGLYILYFLGLNVGFPLIIALAIAFVDALPILGSGTIMIPWGIIAGLNGDFLLGISVVALWIIMSVTRQFIEPKIVSGNIGIHPIFTIAAMYTGFKFIGILGMFVGPIVLIILKNIFSKFLNGGILKTLFDLE